MSNLWITDNKKMTHVAVWILFFSIFGSASGIALGTLLLAVFGIWQFRDRIQRLPQVPLFWPITLLIAALCLSVLLAPGQGFGKSVGKLRYLALYFPLVWYFAAWPQTRRQFATAGVWVAVFLGTAAVLQFCGWFCPLHDLGFTRIRLAELQGTHGQFFHARGMSYHHNPFAYTTLLLYHLLLGRALTVTTHRERRFFFLGAGFCILGIVLSSSRGSWVALTLSSAVVFGLFARKHWRVFATLGATLGVLFAALWKVLASRATSLAPSSNPERLRLWEICWDLFKQRPLTGHGYHYGFELQRSQFMTDVEKANPTFPTDPHSIYFDLLATTGVLGLFSFVAFLVAAFVSYVRGFGMAQVSKDDRGVLIAGVGALISFTVGSAFDSHFFHTQTLMATVLWLALGQSVVFQYSAATQSTRKSL